MFYQRVRYTISDPVNGDYELKVDPIGWDTQERKNSRSEKNLGFTAAYGDGITFVKDGAQRIGDILKTQGKKAKIKIRRDERHPHTDEWVLDYENYLDLHTVNQENNEISVEFIEAGLKTTISDLFKDKFELDRITSIKGDTIPSINYSTINNYGRKVFFQSLLRNKEAYTVVHNNFYYAFDTNVIYNDDDSAKSTFSVDNSRYIGFNSSRSEKFWDVNQTFYRATSTRKLIIIIEVDYTVSNVPSGSLSVGLSRGVIDGQGQVTTETSNDIELYRATNVTESSFRVKFKKELEINVTSGVHLGLFGASNTNSNGFMQQYRFDKDAVKIIIKEDSFFEKTSNQGMLLSEAIDRWLYIATGESGLLVNEMPGNSIFSNTFICSGLQIRQFPKIDRSRVVDVDALDPPEPVIESTIKASMEDLISYRAYEPFDWSVENGKVHIKPLQDLFKKETGLVLEEYTNPKRSYASGFIFSKIIIGNDKAGDYDEQVGLFEYNTKSEWLTVDERSDNELKLLSNLRTDSIGVEWSRRLNIKENPTEDHSADDDIFAFHIKKDVDGNYTPRLWRDDFETLPQTYDPESAYNLMLSPANSLKRWGFYINTGLYIYPNEYVRFANSKGYDKMVTKQFGKPAVIENQDHRNKDLGKPIFKDELIEIETILEFNERQSMNDLSFMEKRVKLTNTGEYGYILDSSVEGNKGTFKLLKSI